MQQQSLTPEDGSQQQEPDWVLASYGQRIGAWALDFVGFTLPLILLRFRLLIGYADDSISALWQAQTRQTRKIQARFGIC